MGLFGHSCPQYWANSFPISCAVLGLDSCNYCSKWARPDSLPSSSYCLPQWHHSIRGCRIPSNLPPCKYIMLFQIFTYFSFMGEIVQSCKYLGLLDLAFQSSSSRCLVLILHRQLGNHGFHENQKEIIQVVFNYLCWSEERFLVNNA